MDALGSFLASLKRRKLAEGHFLGFLHVLIGRTISGEQGLIISRGAPWRELAAQLKKVRWNPEAVREIGIDPAELPPRDRFRYWYLAIGRAQVDSPQAVAAGERFASLLREQGYTVSDFVSS
jgi:hypothetical protein